MKPRSGDTVECIAPLYSGAHGEYKYFNVGEQGKVTIVKPYVKGEYIYIENFRTGEVDTAPLEMFKSHFKIVARKDDE